MPAALTLLFDFTLGVCVGAFLCYWVGRCADPFDFNLDDEDTNA